MVLLGPRQVGKTTLARQIAASWPQGAVYLDLEQPSDRRRLDDAEAYLRAQAPRLVVIDEIHRAPELFAVLRGLIDERRAVGQRFGHFLLLGSAALDLMRQSSETLAGQVAYLDMAPVGADEAASASLSIEQLWQRGGFPDSLLAADDALSFGWRQDFIRSYLERDVPMFAPRLPAETLGRLWTMLAHQQGGLLNQAQLASSLGVSAPTVARYVDLLSDLHLVRRLMPWSANVGEIDLLIERGGRPDMAIEVKRSTAPSPDRGFGPACDDLGVAQRWVVYPGSETFPLRQGAQAIGLLDLVARLTSPG